MISFKKTIFTGFSPNLNGKNVMKACGFLFLPWMWAKQRKGDGPVKVEDWLKNYFKTSFAHTFDSGRSALYYALKSLGVKPEDEILVQAYTCVVVSNAINWTGAKPIYVDIDDNFNMDYRDLEKKISPKSKILIIQHTFGQPANLEKLLEIAQKYNLKVIEDCAHSLGARHNKKLTGTFGDIGMFSFGSDKNVSCVRGGALITNDPQINSRLIEFKDRLPLTNRIKTIQHLAHFPIFFIGKNFYSLKIGKWLFWLAKKTNLINKIIYSPEKLGKQILFYPAILSNSLAQILLDQLEKLDEINKQRQAVAKVYDYKISNTSAGKPIWNDESVWLRYTLRVEDPKKWHKKAKQTNIILGNWYDTVIAPRDIKWEVTGYVFGSCPNAEKLSAQSINLPTDQNLTKEDIKRILDLWK